MARPKILAKSIRDETVEAMTALGTYKPEYSRIIDLYAGLCEQYERLNKEFIDGGMEYETTTGADGVKKAPLVATLESLRKDILQFSDRLMLNPKAKAEVGKKSKVSKLAEALSSGL